ncbi:MAG: hypothetical protein ACR2OW_03920 [Methyloligellaceae bacterium]
MNVPRNPYSRLTADEYLEIETALIDSERGRAFLREFAERNRNADTAMVLRAISKLEHAFSDNQAILQNLDIRAVLKDMSQSIARAKDEVAVLHPSDDNPDAISGATAELDDIVKATEHATNKILAAAEDIQETAWTMREAGIEEKFCERLDSRATEIYSECSFQDLTGQRTSGVVKVLNYLEERLQSMISIWDNTPTISEQSNEMQTARPLLSQSVQAADGKFEQAEIDTFMRDDNPGEETRYASGNSREIAETETIEITVEKSESEDIRFGEISPEYNTAIAYTVPPEVEEAENNLEELRQTDEERRAALFK